jgi:hypothetical protein
MILMLLSMLVPLGAMAQVPDRVAEDTSAAEARTTPASLMSASSEPLAASSAEGQPRPSPAPSPDPSSPRRRGSMVGYIDDAIVGSKIRIRFDAGLHNNTPDRAEFFYAKCGCYRDLPPSNPAFDPNAPGPRPGAANDLNFQQIFVQGEYALSNRFSVFGHLPLRWIQPKTFATGTGAGFPNQGGLGDIQVGAKYALLSESNQVVTVKVQAFLPTGKASEGLGTDHASLQPALLLYQQFSDRLALESQIGDWIPFGGSAGNPTSSSDKFAGNVFFYGIGPSYEVYRSGAVRFAPVIELVGWHVVNGFQTSGVADASGTNIVNLKVGARVAWNAQGSLYVGWGHGLTDATWYENIVRFEYRYAF